MVTDKLNVTDDKSAAKAKRGRQKQEPEAAQESQVEGRQPLYLQITPAAKNILENIAKQGVTKARVIENLLEYFKGQNEKTKKEILKGSIKPRQEYDDLLGLLHWAQHAFDSKRYILAAKYYTDITNRFNTSEGFTEFCNYKLGTCWIRLSYELRREALKDFRDDESYPLAQKALNAAIDYTKEVKGLLGGPRSILIKHYNLACCHSLKAQYLVEYRLDPQDKFTLELRNACQDIEATVKVWEKGIGVHWREKDKGRNADSEAQQALKELQEMYAAPNPERLADDSGEVKETDLLLERIWLTEAALEDEDLIFLRFDKQKWQTEFTKWSDSVLHQGDNSIADTIRVLLQEK
jgi:hypothetical protein